MAWAASFSCGSLRSLPSAPWTEIARPWALRTANGSATFFCGASCVAGTARAHRARTLTAAANMATVLSDRIRLGMSWRRYGWAAVLLDEYHGGRDCNSARLL